MSKELEYILIAKSTKLQDGTLSSEWRIENGSEAALSAYCDLSMDESAYAYSVFTDVVRSTDYDLTDNPAMEGPFCVAICHETVDFDDTEDVDDFCFYVDTLPEATAIFNEHYEKDSLYIASIYSNVIASNVFSKGLSVDEAFNRLDNSLEAEKKSHDPVFTF